MPLPQSDYVTLNPMPTTDEIVDLYRRRARNYDLTANLYYLVGFREFQLRKRAVGALALCSGATVVEIGCGTGLNFEYLRAAVGPTGRIVGVDVTDAMLDRARRRVEANGWTNVELVQCDAAEFEFPPRTDAVLSTFAITLVPEYAQVIRRAARALEGGGTIAICDLKMPRGKLAKLVPLAMPFVRPFGVRAEYAERRPWQIIEEEFENYRFTELFGGMAYLAEGQRIRHMR